MTRTGLDPATELHVSKSLEALGREFEGVHSPEQIEHVLQDSVRQISNEASVEHYVPALAGRLARERLRSLGQTQGTISKDVPEVVFVGLHDTGRGQMAAALMRECGGSRVNVHSAGSGTLAEIDPAVAQAMEEAGIHLEEAYSKPLTEEVLGAADVVVTMGRSVGEVMIPAGARHLDWRLGDPGGAAIDEVRKIRDEIRARVQRLCDEITQQPDGPPFGAKSFPRLPTG
ncbi:MAG: arsenate reductase ArsC [Actinobacteria bacterium]|nr:arsenate reductase ArsC [Actinomycetota bacterium]